MSTDPDERALWEFALALYSSPGVEETALRLQDGSGVNVNVLLWTCWLESRGIPLTPTLLADARIAIEDWDQQVVKNLRQLRRRVKALQVRIDNRVNLHSALKQAEVLAEKETLALLSRLVLPQAEGRPAAGANAESCLRMLGIQEDVSALKRAMTKRLPN